MTLLISCFEMLPIMTSAHADKWLAKFPTRCRDHLIKTWKFTALLLGQPQSLRKHLGKL